LNSKYKTVVIIVLLVMMLSVILSVVNYTIALKNAHEQLKTQALPLSLDNIYTDIQKHIIEPYLVSSMMANDTFVQDWLNENDQNDEKIIRYLEAIKNKYEMFNTFLVSDTTKKYYTQNGHIETISADNVENKWYFKFKDDHRKHEINLDFNEHLSNHLIMFINYKIFNQDYTYMGATGVALKIEYIDDMLRRFRIEHNFIVTFFNKEGDLVLSENVQQLNQNIDQMQDLAPYKDFVLSKQPRVIEYNKNGTDYILNTKYIPELDLFLVVEANLESFTQHVRQVLYFNVSISLIVTLIIGFLVYIVIRRYSQKIEYISHYDVLTNISNRRDFEEKMHYQLSLQKRNHHESLLVFVDIDNFKTINDTFGHTLGDEVLKRVALIFKEHIREVDLLARWGGEEFILLFVDISLDEGKKVTNKLRTLIAEDQQLKKLVGQSVTGSFGVTKIGYKDTLDEAILRADKAMYEAKNGGKNRVYES
jgi:diguanylate cyclase (GGDEF)-like protein